jgi:predicted dehydrogenase
MFTLVIINPGHFHAGLVLREMHPEISKDVYIYSEPGIDLDNYMKLVQSFNNRAQNPTSWVFHVYAAADFMEKAVMEKKGDIAILAGKNNMKIHYIKSLHDAGFKVLSDKPLTINRDGVKVLKEVLAGGSVLMDIMTEHHEITSLIQRELVNNKAIFGDFRIEKGSPAIIKESVHHLYKMVNGAPLVRPGWYFDVNVQGDGIVDVTTHLVDLIQWMVFGDSAIDFAKDVELCEARRWSTDVPLDKYMLITKLEKFPANLAANVEGNTLKLFSNGDFCYCIKGLPVKLSVIWALEAPAGGGDTHKSVMKGSVSDLIIDQGPQTGNRAELYAQPHGNVEQFEGMLKKAIAAMNYAGLSVIKDGGRFRIDIPAALRTSHEEHFAAIRDEFLEILKSGKEPANLRVNLFSKYALLADAREMALKHK